MSSIMRAGVVLAGALLLISVGCSKERTSGSGVLINPDTGKHAPQWATPAMHGAAAKGAASSTSGLKICQDCHSTDFSGGISKITCLNMMGCHGAGVMAPHSPKPWRGGMMTHTDTDPSNAPVCAQCHMNGANSSVQPSPFDPAAAPGCFNNTLCHSMPACGTCHGIPPNGTILPNVAGQHAPHIAVNSSIIGCATCHMGAGFGTPLHMNGVVDVILDTTFNAESGTAAYDPASVTCSNISCHGGQTTPGWRSGTLIEVNTQCTACHVPGSKSGTVVTPQFNSYWSGRHSLHLSSPVNAACTECHDTTSLAGVHFLDLDTTAMINSYQTILSGLNYTGTATATGGCTLTCHSQSHTANQNQW